MLASIPSATVLGVRGSPVTVEVFVGDGLPGYHMVGMPDTAVRESRDRVRAAVSSGGFAWPTRCITVNLAPTSQRKSGAGLDLAIAIGVLVASSQLAFEAVEGCAFIGELGLDGTIRRVPGVAPMVDALDVGAVVVPLGNAVEAQIAARAPVHGAADLGAVVAALTGSGPWDQLDPVDTGAELPSLPDLSEVRGQAVARRALEIAAAGGHHLLLVGSPGSGKTMLAQRLAGLLPPLGREQALETTMIHSAAGLRLPPGGLVRQPPFRAPHHTTSVVGLVGGGSHQLRPGEVSLANNGVLFMDELGEFGRAALEGLREPLEEGVIRVARAAIRAVMPARFLLVAATNPCPCGGGPPGACECDDGSRARYLRRLSGPVTDRFDLRVVVQRPAVDELLGVEPSEPSAAVRQRVIRRGTPRSPATASSTRRSRLMSSTRTPLTDAARALLRDEVERDRLTGRGYHRVRRVARTIADLDEAGDAAISVADVELALQMRTSLRDPALRPMAVRGIA